MIATGKASWAKVLPHQLVTDNKYKDYNYWSIDLVVTDEEKERLKGLNIRPYHKDDGETETNIFKFERKETTKKGKEQGAPTVVDGAKNPWDSGEIGNDSVINVSFFTYEHAKSKKFGLGKSLNAIQVLEHVPYAGGGGASEFTSVAATVDDF